MLLHCGPPARPRLVDEYTKGPDGAYHMSRHNVEFSAYMRDNGYHIIPIKPQHQLVRALAGTKGFFGAGAGWCETSVLFGLGLGEGSGYCVMPQQAAPGAACRCNGAAFLES